MILYVNGDSHTAAAEAVNRHAFAEDDSRYFYMGRAPHPDNFAISYARILADKLKATLNCQAESASSNERILRTTKDWISKHEKDLYRTTILIQWSTWEREEWLIENDYYQVNASGIDHVPQSHQQTYKEYVAGIDWQQKTEEAHLKIWNFHQWLKSRNIQHIFFNGNTDFSSVSNQQDWGVNYIQPYNPNFTYNKILLDNGFETVSPQSYHYGADAHSFWAKYLLNYFVDNQLY